MSQPHAFDRALVSKYDFPGPRYTSYPTAPQFHEAFAMDDYRLATKASNADPLPKPLSVYVHIPFCKSLCHYCACNKIITQKTEKAAEYLDYLKREIAMQAELFKADRRLTQLHLGGGTPTYFTNAQLAELMVALRQAFRFDTRGAHEFSVEVDPRTVTPERLHALRRLGFNRLSFGVQDFDPDVQAAVNRIQSESQVCSLVEAAREADFDSLSVDLIYGLPLQNVESFDATLAKVIDIRPNRIAAYSYAHLPSMFKSQRLIRPEHMPPPERKLELLELTIQRLTAAINAPNRVSVFGDLRRHRESTTSLRNRLSQVRRQLARWEERQGGASSELQAVREDRRRIERALGGMPTSEDDFISRDDQLLGRYRMLQRELSDLEVELLGAVGERADGAQRHAADARHVLVEDLVGGVARLVVVLVFVGVEEHDRDARVVKAHLVAAIEELFVVEAQPQTGAVALRLH